jgi:hypothetical protein
MMSQNRQEARDRLHAMRDYQVTLKARFVTCTRRSMQGVPFDFLVDPFDSFDGPSLLFH